MYKVKMRFKRLRVRWRRWKRSLDNSIKPASTKPTPYEEKGIRLWKMVVKDEDTQMAYNSYGVRQIEKDTLFITVSPHNGIDRYTMTIMDITSERRSLYELHIDGKHADSVCEAFDVEMERRMAKVESSKRSLIESDIDKLIEEATKVLSQRIKEKEEKEEKEKKTLTKQNK